MFLKIKKITVPMLKKALDFHFWLHTGRTLFMFSGFFILLILFIFQQMDKFIFSIPILGSIWKRIPGRQLFNHLENAAHEAIERVRTSEVKRTYLISLAYKNLMVKKTRSFITILGMSVGIGIIVFLLSLGYGIEKLVISKVAGLDELKMIDVTASENTALRLTKNVFDKISKLAQVNKTAPLISVVGKISYNRATTDMLAYAAPKSYLEIIKIKLLKGKIYSNNETFGKMTAYDGKGQVAGAETGIETASLNSIISAGNMSFSIIPGKEVTVWEDCSLSSKLLGYSIRIEGGYNGEEIWGEEYTPFSTGRSGFDQHKGIYLGKWIKGKVPIYDKREDGSLKPVLEQNGIQTWSVGCIKKQDIVIDAEYRFAEVLGESTASAEIRDTVNTASDSSALGYDTVVVSSDSGGIEMVMFQASGSGEKKTNKTLSFQKKPSGEAIVTSGFINLLGINLNKAVGIKFKSSFVISKNLIPDIEGRAISEEVEYTIIGVIDDPDNTYFYIPFEDMKILGISNFSQMKIVLAKNEDNVKVRKSIETMGFRTASTIDTVKQIESLFVNLRVILGILGLVALGVASLGMFNTLTVSLLERTREIGGMKTMGMVSEEVQDLFLAEAMIMGLAGGVGGLSLGFFVGKTISFLVSVFALAKGQEYLDLTYLPLDFVIFIFISSFMVGVLTGIYPAERAKKISALNALRYE